MQHLNPSIQFLNLYETLYLMHAWAYLYMNILLCELNACVQQFIWYIKLQTKYAECITILAVCSIIKNY